MELRKWFEQLLTSAEFAAMYQRLRDKFPPLESFPLPQKLTEFLTAREPSNYKTQDKILYSIICECRNSQYPPILILYLFILLLPFLEIPFIYWKKRLSKANVHDDELWNEVWCGFHKALIDYDFRKRKRKIGLYFQGRVRNYVDMFYRNSVDPRLKRVTFDEEDEMNNILFSGTDQMFSDEDWFTEYTLDRLISENTIDLDDKCLIIENFIWRKSLRVIAREKNVPYQALKKRMYRLKIKLAEELKIIYF